MSDITDDLQRTKADEDREKLVLKINRGEDGRIEFCGPEKVLLQINTWLSDIIEDAAIKFGRVYTVESSPLSNAEKKEPDRVNFYAKDDVRIWYVDFTDEKNCRSAVMNAIEKTVTKEAFGFSGSGARNMFRSAGFDPSMVR